MKKRMIYMAAVILLLGGSVAEGMTTRSSLEKRLLVWKEIKGEELWRKGMGAERSLLLYRDEKGETKMVFTDGPWVYMTDALVERIEKVWLELWAYENGGEK